MHSSKVISVLVCGFILAARAVYAKETEPTSRTHEVRALESIECLSGFGMAKLRKVGTYHIVPLYVDFNFDLKEIPFVERLNYAGPLQWGIEPFVSYAFDPKRNYEYGANIVVKAGILPEGSKVQPYAKLSLGGIYFTQDNRDQGSSLNFNEYAGLGVNYFFQKDTALTLEYRYRHISNLDIKEPNKGINTNLFLAGVVKEF